MTAEIVNLKAVRKRRTRAEARALATDNALRHGRTKVQKALDKARAEKALRDLDAHARGSDPAP